MIYDEPIYRPLGDCMLGVEFGDEANLELSFKVLELERLVREAKITGIVETVVSLRELALVLDRTKTTNAKVQEALDRVIAELGEVKTLPSRRWLLPCWYDDPWSSELAARYGVENNLEIVARENGLTKEQVVERHTSGEFWVVCVGFTPGCYFSAPLDPAMHMAAPKWKTPRDYTPARCLALAGFSTGAYPVASPGGYQLLGRLAVNIYEPHPRNAAFPPDGVLLRAGDRIRYRAVDALEYDRIWTEVEAGRYEYDVVTEDFDVAGYVREFGRTSATGGGVS
jgi:urea carboxylase